MSATASTTGHASELPRDGGAQQALFLRLTLLVRRWWRGLGLTLAANLLNHACGAGAAAAGALAVAQVAQGAPAAALTPYLVALAGLTVGKAVFTWLEMWFAHNVAYGMLAALRSAAYDKVEPLAPAYTLGRRSGDIVAMVMSDIETIEVFFAHTLIPMIAMAVVPAVLLVALATIAPLLAVALLPFIALLLALPFIGRNWGEPLARTVRQQQGQVNAHLVDSIQGIRELMAFGRGEARAAEVTRGSASLGTGQISYSRFLGSMVGTTETIVALGAVAILLTSAWLAAHGQVDRFAVPLILVLAFNAFAPVVQASNVAQNLNQVAASARRYFDIVDEPVRVVERTTVSPGRVEPVIAFENVAFAYHAGQPQVLRGLSFGVQPGETVALVGPSGAGKSTCVSLLLRFWDPDAGAVKLGGFDLRDFPLDDLRRRIAVVQQDNYLFNTTIGENIRIGKPDATEAELIAAAQRANIHEFITGLPDGYHTRVGERGVQLSGGQRQRLAIARAFLKDAPVLILDEATSNLDTENEQIIRAAIARLMEGRTTLVIAHRLSTIVSADRVVMLDGGAVVAEGRHADLVQRAGPYASLIAAQRQSAGVP